MDDSVYLEHVRRDALAIAAALAGDLSRPVPSCPGWTLADLAHHVGDAHRFWTEVVDRQLMDARERTAVDPPEGDLGAWIIDGADRLIAIAGSVDPHMPIWGWSHRKEAGFVPRRMAHETAMHRWDAQAALGDPHPIAPELARDGVDEFFDTHVPAEEAPVGGSGEKVHLHQTDGDGEWVITLGPRDIDVAHGHEHCEAAVRATGSDLVLLLWRRIRPEDVDVLGDRMVLDRLLGWVDLS